MRATAVSAQVELSAPIIGGGRPPLLLIPVVLLVLAVVVFGLIGWRLVVIVKATLALATLNRRHWRILWQIHKVGKPWLFIASDDYEYCLCRGHEHAQCTGRCGCAIKRKEEYLRLSEMCKLEHVPDWRHRWAA
jgi:hypothetical protein